MELDPKSKSAQEIEALWGYISDRLEKNFRRTVFAAPAANPGYVPQRPMSGFGRRVVS
jgi:chromosome partitioning protein